MNYLANIKPHISATHVADYHLFSVQDSIEFVSLSIRIVQWMRNYQSKVFKAIMDETSIPGMTLKESSKRNHLDSDHEGEPEKKRRYFRQSPSESWHDTSESKSGQQYEGLHQNAEGQTTHDQPLQDYGCEVSIRIQNYSRLILSRILIMALMISLINQMMRECSQTMTEILALA